MVLQSHLKCPSNQRGALPGPFAYSPIPFGARFSERFRPVAVHGIYADGDTVVVLWDGESTRGDGKPYENAYAWFMRFREGLVVEATAFYDSIAFNEL
jgi:uncharacterized protein